MLGNFQDTCIHQLFEFQVKLTPDAIAVIFEGKQLTYQELNSQANQLGHYLKTLGVGPEVLVAACVERSLEMVSCCAFKLYVEGGQDAHPTRGKIYFTMRFKCGLA